MTVSHAAEDRILGGERITDGLWQHKGKLSVGPMGARANGTVIGGPGDLNVNRGQGQGAIYFGGQDNYLYYDGTKFVFSPQLSTSAIAPGATMVLQAWWAGTPSGVSTPQGSWFEVTASRTTVNGIGKPMLIDINATLQHTVANAGIYLGYMIDSNPGTYVFTQAYAANAQVSMSLNHVVSPSAGAHTLSIAILTFTTGTLSIPSSGVYTSLRVVELRGA